ncbi:MAG TPA: hypothetical protein VLE74_03985 [Candidatus Saccharimonadales bacterium]|nr:hypothetical protein [Candidatus Saccharimonadales bacterium]
MTGTPQTVGPTAGTSATSTASCAAGKVVLGGGTQVTTTATPDKVALTASYPSATNIWTGKATILTNLGNGNTMTVTAYALCSL